VINVLLIGCGNIGALYDFENNLTKTHCKALSLIPNLNISIFDENIDLAELVAKKYGYNCILCSKQINLSTFKWVIIATPTNTHFEWLSKSVESNVPLIICEKPISKNILELNKLLMLYKGGKSKILINFIRRFQPAFLELKKIISSKETCPIQLIVKYQRGILNNFSHAADLLSFLFNTNEFKDILIVNFSNDEFEDDPTVSFVGFLGNIPINVIGLQNVKYSYFEIEICYEDSKINVTNTGDNIEYFFSEKIQGVYKPLRENLCLTKDKILENYMIAVYEHAIRIYKCEVGDNFVESLLVNQQIIKLKNN